MTWATLLPILLSSGVIVAIVKVAESMVSKWKPPSQVQDERSERAFHEMEQVAEAYRGVVEVHKTAAAEATTALERATVEIDGLRAEVGRLTLQVRTLEHSLTDAADTITQLMALVGTTG